MSLRSFSPVAVIVCLVLAGPAAAQPFAEVARLPGGAAVEPAEGNDLAERAAFIAQYDDGSAETFIGPISTTHEVAMLFEGVGGPDVTLGGVDFCWRRTGADSKIRYEVVIWAADGPGGAPGAELAKFAAVAEGVTNAAQFFSTNLDYPLTRSDVYIGVRWNPVVDEEFFYCLDYDGLDGVTVQPGYDRIEEAGSWRALADDFPDYNALMVRASLATPGVFAEILYLPFFLVDTVAAGGTNTLFAVRNLTGETVFPDVEYFTRAGVSQGTDELTLGPYETETVSLRDVPGLATSPDGFARGYVQILAAGNPDMTPVLGGDYFQVDVEGAFATGDRLVRQVDLCTDASIRFLDFGAGTRLTVFVSNPRGSTPGVNPPSFTIQAYDEAGNPVSGAQPVWTANHGLELLASDYAPISFGTLRFDFSPSFGGTVYAEYSADGLFSVGVTGQCDELP